MKNIKKEQKMSSRKGLLLFPLIVIGTVIAVSLTGCNTLQSIEVSREPERTVLGQGQRLDTSGLEITMIRRRDTEVTADRSAMRILYNNAIPGEQAATVTIGTGRRAQSTAFIVTVVPVAQLTITQAPAVTLVLQGDDLDYTGFAAQVEFENEAVPGVEISLGQAHLSFSGFDRNRSGVQTVTADYFGRTDTFEVRVAAFLGLDITSPPVKTEYFVGEALNLSGLAVLGRWEGYQRLLTITQEHISNFDINRAGQHEVIITYLGGTASFNVTSVGFAAISIMRPPSRVSFANGEHIDLSGMQLQGTRMGSTTLEMLDVSRAQITGFNRFRAGQQRVTISFGGRSDTFLVTVGPSPLVGTWSGTTRAGGNDVPMTLVMTENTWRFSWPAGQGIAGEYMSGTYVRDTETGRTVVFTRTGGQSFVGAIPQAGELLSPREFRVTGVSFFDNITFTR